MPLSEFAARKAKPKNKAYKLTDGGGLFLHIQPGGSKLWRMKYRHAGKEKLLSFGPYPLIGIAEARKKRDEAKKQLLDGKDPSAEKKLAKLAAEKEARQTFGLIADEYLERLKERGAAESTISKITWLLKKLTAPLDKRPIRDIHPAEILDILQKIEKSGRRETARRLRGTISTVFKHAIVTLRATNDPTIPLHGALLAPKVEGRAAITDEKELGVLLNTIDDYDGWPTIKAGLQFLILTCVRPGEVCGAVRSEFDLKKAVWEFPVARMKMRRPHRVPLSKQAVAILEDIWPLSDGAELVFPSIRTKPPPTLRKRLQRRPEAHGLAGKAADSLQAASGIASRTLAYLEASWKSGYEPVGTGDVVVIDEAGMVGTRQLARVAEQLRARGCKLVLIGDPDQLQPIQAGTPFRDIVDKTGAARLTEIRRQMADWQRKASRDLAEGQTDLALQSYADHRAVHKTADREQAIASLVDDYMADLTANGSAWSRLALAHRRKDVHAINQAIKRQKRAETNRPSKPCSTPNTAPAPSPPATASSSPATMPRSACATACSAPSKQSETGR